MKTAILFAGQGSQYPGMGKNLYDTNPAAQKIFDLAGESIKNLCFHGDKEQLSETKNTQPCIFTLSIAHFEALKAAGVTADAVAGFSVGEYSALCASEMFSFENGLELVSKRGAFMGDIRGSMAAVLCDQQKLTTLLDGWSVEPVNYNCPGQVVVAGHKADIESFVDTCKQSGVKAIQLAVSGPFHSSLMKPAADKLEQALNAFTLNAPSIPVVLNTTGKFSEAFNEDNFKKNMIAQTKSPVLWECSIRTLIDSGIDTMIEVGPGKTLSGFVKKIDKKIKLISAEEFLSK